MPELAPKDALIVTTSGRRSELEARARAIAARCGVPFLARRGDSLRRLFARSGASLAYVVSVAREEVRGLEGPGLSVHPGMLHLKRRDKRRHPLVRAVAPPGAADVEAILDATMGLAGDALHLAYVLGARVEGIEASPVIASLLEEGTARMARSDSYWAEAAGRLQVTCGDHVDLLRQRPDASVPVVYLDPMFDRPSTAQPGFDLLRRYARHAPLDDRALAEACRVAARRVVIKLPGGAALPDHLTPPAPGFNRRVRGKAVDYLVIERELDTPEFEAPDFGTPPEAA